MIYSYFKDNAFTAVKEINSNYNFKKVKAVPFVNRSYMKGEGPFLSKVVYKMVRDWTYGWSLSV